MPAPDPTMAALQGGIKLVERYNALINKVLGQSARLQPLAAALKAIPLLALMAIIVKTLLAIGGLNPGATFLYIAEFFYCYMLVICGIAALPSNAPSRRRAARNTALGLLLGPAFLIVVWFYLPLKDLATNEWYQSRILMYRYVDGGGWRESLRPPQFNKAAISLSDLDSYLEPPTPVTSISQVIPTKDAADATHQAALLQLISARNTIEIGKTSVMPEQSRPGVIWITAKRIVFSSNSVLRIGNRNLLLATYDLEINPGARIEAFDKTSGRSMQVGHFPDGADSGNVYLIVLGSVLAHSGAKLMVNLAGENGSQGEPGNPGEGLTQGSAPVPPANGASEIVSNAQNENANGKYLFESVIKDARDHTRDLPSDDRARAISTINECAATTFCLILRCTNPPGDGPVGLSGQAGRPGDTGGNGGNGGELHLYAEQTSLSSLEEHVELVGRKLGSNSRDGASSSAGEGGKGGPPSQGGPGGAAGREDPLGICPKGRPGQTGNFGPAARAGSPGRPGTPSRWFSEPIWPLESP